MMRRKPIFWILISLAVIAGSAFGVRYVINSKAAAEPQWLTQTLSLRDLTSVVTADGVVASNQSIVLDWQASGIVDLVKVSTGDLVVSGQELASLKPSSLPQEIILAQVDLANAEKALQDLYKPPTDLALAQAAQAVADAQKKVEDAEYHVKSLQTHASQKEIDGAYAAMALAKNRWESAKEQVARIERKVNKNPNTYSFFESRKLYKSILQSLQLKEINDRKAYLASVDKYNNLLSGADPTEFAIAQADLAFYKAQLRDAQKNEDDLRSGPSSDDIAAAQAKVAAAQAFIDRAKVKAPFNGRVTQISTKNGNQVSAGAAAFRIDDLSKLLVEVEVTEVDINRIQVGQAVTLTLDSAPGSQYDGSVVEVPPAGFPQQNITNFKVKVLLNNPDAKVRPGMTARAHIIVDHLKNVLAVPNRAIRFQDDHQVVYLLQDDGSIKAVQVNPGVSSGEFSALSGGILKAGDQIVLNPPSGTASGN
jgi:HlyD family secretion protein